MSRVLLSEGTMRGVNFAPIAPCVVRSNHAGRGRDTLALTVQLDVEALDEQMQREAEAEHDEPGGW